MKKYPKLLPGEFLRVDLSNNDLTLSCCDCGKVHRVQFHHIKGKTWDFAFFPDNRATGQLRRHKYGKLQNLKRGWVLTRIPG